MKCHKDLSQDCVERNCPMFFEPPMGGQKGECVEALYTKQLFWTSVVEAIDKDKASTLVQANKEAVPPSPSEAESPSPFEEVPPLSVEEPVQDVPS